jgi:hypothetical protein
MYYSAQKNGATAREIDQLRYAAKQSGEGADKAVASFDAFSQRIRDAASGTAVQYKNLFGVDVDPNHTMDAFLKVREKIEELRNRGGPQNLSLANLYARTFGIDEDALVSGRLAIFKKAWIEQAKRNEGIAADKAVALTRAYNALAAALETVARKADAALFDKFGAVLDRLTKWLDEDSERIVKFFTDLVTQIGLVFTDLKKLSPAFVLLWSALKETGSWLQKIIGQPDGTGLAGVRHLLEFISGVVIVRFAAAMAAGFVTAFAPVTLLLAALAALGVISVGAYAAGEAVRGWLGGVVPGGVGGGFGPSEGTASGGHGPARRRRFGHGGSVGRGHTGTDSGSGGKPNANFTAENAKALRESAARLGTTPEDLATVIGYETEGTFSPSKWGGAGGRYMGLIQFGPSERTQYGANENQTFAEQLGAVERYLKDRGFKPGMGINDLYSTILAGRPGLNRADSGGTVNQHVERMKGAMAARAHLFLKSGAQESVTHWDPHFDRVLKIFRNAKPLGGSQHSMNHIHDYRVVQNETNIHVAGGFPVDKTARPLSRPKNADIIRNTASYAA